MKIIRARVTQGYARTVRERVTQTISPPLVMEAEKEAEAKCAARPPHSPHSPTHRGGHRPNELDACSTTTRYCDYRRLAAKYGGALPKRPGLLGAKEKKYFDSADHSMNKQSAHPSPAAESSTSPAPGSLPPTPPSATQPVPDQPEHPPNIR